MQRKGTMTIVGVDQTMLDASWMILAFRFTKETTTTRVEDRYYEYLRTVYSNTPDLARPCFDDDSGPF